MIMPGKRKGNRRERECLELYERAGYRCYKPQESQWGETDMFGLFDLVAVRSGSPVDFVQVKSNRATGIEDWAEEAGGLLSDVPARATFAVCHDRGGWRLIRAYSEGTYGVHYDGRDHPGMGEGLVEYLRGGSGE